MKKLCSLALLLSVCLAPAARADFRFVVTKGYDKPTAVSVVPFCWEDKGVLPEQISTIVGDDMARTGQFTALSPDKMLSQPCESSQVFFRDWKLLKQDYLVIGQISKLSDGKYEAAYRLYDVFREKNIYAARVSGTREQLRDMAHVVADNVYQKITGIKGVFSTKIAYVTMDGSGDKALYRLEIADADGHRAKTLFKSRNSIISLAWSADGKQVAFTNFDEKGHTVIKAVDRFTGKVTAFPAYPGINSGAAFSPDGKTLAFVNSQSGNADVYLMDLATKNVTKMTRHWAIDTEPSWSPDGKKLLFTSERGGRPQIYQLELATRRIERLTFEGIYNAKAHYSSDGKYIIMVHRGRKGETFRVAALDLETGQLRVLTETVLDESPSIAPNGTMLVYATQNNGQGVLAWASVDGQLASIMPAAEGRQVREPSWSPFIH